MTRGGNNRSAMPSQKVYIINEHKHIATQKPMAGAAGKRATRTPGRETYAPLGTKSTNWPSALRTYAFGPISLVLWPNGKGRRAWAILGVGSLLAAVLLWIWWITVFDAFESSAMVWVASVTLVILSVATAWARVVATSEQVCWPRFFSGQCTVCVLGLVLPGLGLLIAGRRWKAAFAIWCAGLLVAAVVILKHWQRLVAENIGGEDRLIQQSTEGVLAVSAGCVIFGLLAWLVLALDGVRAVSPRPRSGSVANGLALALLVTLVFFLATFRPIPIARDLESAAARLQHHGMRITPIVLCEAASILDPGTPSHLARAATLYDELGLSDPANAKRDLLNQRAKQFASAIGAELVTDATHEATLLWTVQPVGMIDHLPPNP
jgi:hypothetical protein